MRLSIALSLSCCVAFGLAPGRAEAAPMFMGLGDLPEGSIQSQAYGVSASGSTVVGSSASGSGQEAFRWTVDGGMVGLGHLPTTSGGGMVDPSNLPTPPVGNLISYAFGVSADGSVVVGGSSSASGNQAFHWTADGGMVGLGGLPHESPRVDTYPSWGHDVSSDGSVVVGYSESVAGTQAFRWTAEEGMIGLGVLSGSGFGNWWSHAYHVSSDGSVVVGASSSASGNEAFRWTADAGMIGLGDLPGGDFRSGAIGVSADGSVVVGESASASGNEAFRWTADAGMIGLGDLAGGNFGSGAGDVSADGSVIVGVGSSASGKEAFIWDEANGMRSLKEVLIALDLDVTDWTLTFARAVSDDGLTIVGAGINPAGGTEAWIAVIPEPSTALLLAGGLIGLAANASRRRT